MKNLNLIIDSREKRNEHITDAFLTNNIAFTKEKLEFGDYHIRYESDNLVLAPKLVIERKANIDELLQNILDDPFCTDPLGNRFNRELAKVCNNRYRCIILVEDKEFYKNLCIGNYKTKTNPKFARHLIKEIEAKYFPYVTIQQCSKQESPILIYDTLYYQLKQDYKLYLG